MAWNYRLGSPYDDNTIWGSIGRGLTGVADAFWQVQRVKRAQDQQAFNDLQTKLKMFPTADDTTKRQWIDAYQRQVGKNKFWDRGAFQWPTQPGQIQGQPNFMGPVVPPAPGAQTGGVQPSGIPSPFVNPKGITTGGATTLMVTYSTTDAIGYAVGEFSFATTSVNAITTAVGTGTTQTITGPATTTYDLIVPGSRRFRSIPRLLGVS